MFRREKGSGKSHLFLGKYALREAVGKSYVGAVSPPIQQIFKVGGNTGQYQPCISSNLRPPRCSVSAFGAGRHHQTVSTMLPQAICFRRREKINLGQSGVFGIEFIVLLPYLLVDLREHFFFRVSRAVVRHQVLHLALRDFFLFVGAFSFLNGRDCRCLLSRPFFFTMQSR